MSPIVELHSFEWVHETPYNLSGASNKVKSHVLNLKNFYIKNRVILWAVVIILVVALVVLDVLIIVVMTVLEDNTVLPLLPEVVMTWHINTCEFQ